MTLLKTQFAIPANTKVVTFDIFDTLLHRLTRAPVDVFEMVRLRAFEDQRSLVHHELLDGFTEARMRAESGARQRRSDEFDGEGEITFDEIYSQWIENTGAPLDVADWLKKLELDSEKRAFFPSAEGLELYRQARANACKIAFLSDMYLPSDWLQARLVALGYQDAECIPIYVSGELRLSKHTGTMFEHVAKTQKWGLDSTWLHVGDNAHADVKQAKAAGLSAYHAPWAYVENIPTSRRPEFQSNFIYSLVEALDLPQIQSRLPKDPLERIGYKIWGPMLFGFVCWLITKFRQQRTDRALFVARDGWLLMRLFDRLRDVTGTIDVETEYFYMSRKTGYKTGVRDWHPDRAWFYVGGKTGTSAERVFSAAGLCAQEYVDLLTEHGIDDVCRPLDASQRLAVVLALNSVYSDVLLKARDMRAEFGEFYDRTLTDAKRIAFVDVGWVGNMQRCFLHSLSDPNARERVDGFYLGLHRDFAHSNFNLGFGMQSWLNGSPRYNELNSALLSGGVELLEFILSADHGSTIDLARNGDLIEPVLETQEQLEKEHQLLAQRAQRGVVRFVEDYRFLLEIFSPDILSSPAFADSFLRMVVSPTKDEVDQLAGITHSDAPGSNAQRLTLAPKLPLKDILNRKKRAQARKEAFWKAAFDKLNP